MADGNSGLQTRGRVAAFAGPSLALPRVLQHNVIGLGNATPLQPNGKRRRTTTDDTAAGTTAGAATSSPRSSWITTQWGTAAEGRGNCLHCGEDRSMNNITRLKNHLLKCPQFLDSPAAQEAAGRCKEVKAAIAQRQQGNSRVTQQAVELTEQEQFGEDVMRLAIDNNWSFHFVEHATTQAFFEKWLPHLKLPSRWEALRSVAISDSLGHDARSRNVIALVLNPDFWEKNEWIVGTLAPAAKLVEALQADAANLAHVHFGQMAVEDKLDKITRSCPPAFQDDAFDLEQAWAQRMLYGHHPALCLAAVIDPNFRDKHGALLPDQMRSAEDLAARLASSNGQGDDSAAAQVAQRVLSIPATSAGVERLFSVFKFIWSDRRSRLLMGRMWAMAYVYFNTRALKHQEQPMADDAADVARWEEWMASQPVEGAPLL